MWKTGTHILLCFSLFSHKTDKKMGLDFPGGCFSIFKRFVIETELPFKYQEQKSVFAIVRGKSSQICAKPAHTFFRVF